MSKIRICYRVKARLYKPGNGTEELIEVDRFFEEENPLEARSKAFNFFQNYKDVLLDAIHERDQEGFDIEIALRNYLNIEPAGTIPIWGTTMEIDPDYDKGIFLYFMSSEGEFFDIPGQKEISTDSRVIHHITKGMMDNWTCLVEGLSYEYLVYKKYGIDCKKMLRHYDLTAAASHIGDVTLLESPFDSIWEKFTKLNLLSEFFNSSDE